MKPYGLAILIASILVVGCGGEMETGPDAEGEGAPASVVEEEAEEPAVSEGECAPLEREMAMHDATGSPLPFHLPYPEGWDVGEHAESGRVLDLVYQGEGRFADYVLRFMFLGGPSSDPSMTLEILRSDRRNEVTEETVDAGTLYLATTAHARRVTALVPYEEGTHYPTLSRASSGMLTVSSCIQDNSVNRLSIRRSPTPPHHDVHRCPDSLGS